LLLIDISLYFELICISYMLLFLFTSLVESSIATESALSFGEKTVSGERKMEAN
jgi:hypothetical protein